MGNRSDARGAAFNAVRMAYKYPRAVGGVGLGSCVLSAGAASLGWTDPALVLGVGGYSTWAGATGWWWAKHVAAPHSSAQAIQRRSELDQRQHGVASHLDLAEHCSPGALRARAGVLRPSMRELSRRERRRLDPAQLGVMLGKLGWSLPGETVWCTCEDCTLRIGGPRTGKTMSLACHGLDAPGALVTTSTRLDLAEMVHAARSERGRVHFFNPAGLGGLASTVRWRVLDGCEDFAAAQRRAGDLIPDSPSAEAQRWDSQARRVLALFLHAAALTDRSMRDVVRWSSDMGPRSQKEVHEALLSETLLPSGEMGISESARDRAAAARTFYETNDRTRSSITTTMAPALAWVADDRARLLGDVPADAPERLDITTLIERGETLHLIGHEDQGSLAPLIAALVAEIATSARLLASYRPGGRLDPPLTMLLDEAALICPVPLPRWTADMGGRNITLHISVQSLAQLRERWGRDGAGTILSNVAAFLVFGGGMVADDLHDISVLTGEHRMRVIGEDHEDDATGDGERRGEYRWTAVMTESQIRALTKFHVLILMRSVPPVIAKVPQITDRPGWRPVALFTDRARPGQAAASTVPTADELAAMLNGNDIHALEGVHRVGDDQNDWDERDQVSAMWQVAPRPDAGLIARLWAWATGRASIAPETITYLSADPFSTFESEDVQDGTDGPGRGGQR
ncbi:TraM recognition domain-containing protein [Kineosporia rhizophila]|uniref:type IV secretory system conjugative DNA transfer family protein n=1 Tax=Kineosporia rhizophila TaxID=84633 RepID=UPI001E306412|nr:TraM recognition domain-containing protein [Kineosporia rhizophila]MCE0536605.1 TraM recognition domain-containing protein [Kineosporia rhizophila]